METVREFSRAGPCLTLGPLVTGVLRLRREHVLILPQAPPTVPSSSSGPLRG